MLLLPNRQFYFVKMAAEYCQNDSNILPNCQLIYIDKDNILIL